jgi:hypothetical protein
VCENSNTVQASMARSHSYLSMVLQLLLDLGHFFSFLILYRAGRTPWTGDQPVVRPLPTHRTTQTENKRTQTSMPWVGFEPTIPAFEQAKTVHALDQCFSNAGPRPGTGPSSYRKMNLPGCGLTKVENHCLRPLDHCDRPFPQRHVEDTSCCVRRQHYKINLMNRSPCRPVHITWNASLRAVIIT